MKKISAFLVLAFLVVAILVNFRAAFAAGAETESIILATTYSVSDTGLLDGLLKDFKDATGISVKPIVVGSGESLKMGERGECDIIIAHSRDAEEKFMENKFGKDRRPIAKNEFYIVGPEDDPAKIKGSKDVFEAFLRIDKNGAFVSRGDKSGTHNREIAVWKKAGIEKKASANYFIIGQGMSEALRVADEKKAYTLCDSATYAVLKEKLKIQNIYSDPANLTNVYSVITVNPEKLPKVKYDAAKKFFDFMFGEATIKKIESHGVDKYKAPLFTVLDEARKK